MDPLIPLSGQVPRVVLEPVILGNLIIQDDDSSSAQFLENFRRNQTHVIEPHEGSLVLIRRGGLLHNRRNLILPAIIPNLRSRSPIPLPEFPSRRDSFGHKSAKRLRKDIDEEEEEEMGIFQGLWKCECPMPGTQPLILCSECKRRECFEWFWDKTGNDHTTVFENNGKGVIFNPGFSIGTVAVKGSKPLEQGYHHYWEIEMSSDVYGTDMMIGVGTDKTDLRKYTHTFVSLIGIDEESWGLSYTGNTHHNGKVHHYTKNFGQHTIVGVHLDLWKGTMEYFINRKPIGLAFTGLQGKVLYPMISSTAARSGMNLVFCRSYPPSLQLQTMLALGKCMKLPDNVSLFKVLPDHIIAPGLKLWMKNNFWWITSNRKPILDSKTDQNKKQKTSVEPSHETLRRCRKTKKDNDTKEEVPIQFEGVGVATRGMASRRTFIPGTNPIFAPEPVSDGPLPAKSPRVSRSAERQGPVTRSMSNQRDEHEEDETTTPGPGPSSATKRVYNLRSRKQ